MRRIVTRLPMIALLAGSGSVVADAGAAEAVAAAALDQVGVTTSYDPSYRRLEFPNGDVPIATGVCADVVVRALREAGIDLQRELNTDMRAHFRAYPAAWGLTKPDRNIDHRRVPNLRRWFERHGWALAVSTDPGDYLPGDIVSWRLSNGRPHIGVVATRYAADGRRRLVVHNIAFGAREEDVLFAWTVTGHYRLPDTPKIAAAR
ncbi:MAG: DUF1287 domain-containing protein [Rhodanobacteraceae bacterium]|nr:DUF1287 domain-containing protein [Rhodanobacteraceae bacterium]